MSGRVGYCHPKLLAKHYARRNMITLIHNATIITVDSGNRVINHGAIVIKDDRIVAVGPSPEVVAAWPDPDAEINARENVVMPGFISAHNHLGYAVFRGQAEDVGFAPTHRLYLPMSDVISAQERQDIGSLAVAELLRGGVTTVLEMEEDAGLFAPVIESSGIRGTIGVMVNDLELEALTQGKTVFSEQERERQMGQAVDLVAAWNGKAEGRIQTVIAATGLSTSSRALLRDIRDSADRLGVRISMHLGFGERGLVQDVHGVAQFDLAREYGLLAPDVVAVHCYEVDEAEITVLAQSGAHLAHCPLMNQFRGEIAPIQLLRSRGMNVGLGIDNYFSDYFELLRACISSARIRAHHPEVLSASEALYLGTMGSAKALAIDAEVGSLEVGKKADLQIVNMKNLGLALANDPTGTLVYHAHAKDVDLVMVNGRTLVTDGQLVHVDETQVRATASAASSAAWARFAQRHGGFVAPAPV